MSKSLQDDTSADSPASRRMIVGKALGAGSLAQGLGVLAGLATALLSLSLLGLDGFGAVAVLTTFGLVAATIGRAGLDRHVSVLVVESRRSGDRTSLAGAIGFASLGGGVTGLLLGATASLAGFVDEASVSLPAAAILLAIISAADSTRAVTSAALRSNGGILTGLFVGQVGRNVLLAITFAVIQGTRGHLSVLAALGVMAASSLCLAVLGVATLRGWLTTSPDRKLFRGLQLAAGSLVTLVVLSNMLINQVDLLVVARMSEMGSGPGAYALGIKMATLMAFPLAVLNLTLSPTIIRLHWGGDSKRAELLASRAALGGVLASCGIGAVAGFGLYFFGPDLGLVAASEAAVVLQIGALLGLGQLANVVTGMSGSVLLLAGGEREVLAGTLGVGVAAVALEIAAARIFDIHGVAAISGLALASQSAFVAVMAKRRLGISLVAGWRGAESGKVRGVKV